MHMLVDVPPAQAKQILGERLYCHIQVEQATLASKITGMLLEGLDNSELVALIDDAGARLQGKIQEALAALEAHHQVTMVRMQQAVNFNYVTAPISTSFSNQVTDLVESALAAPRH